MKNYLIFHKVCKQILCNIDHNTDIASYKGKYLLVSINNIFIFSQSINKGSKMPK